MVILGIILLVLGLLIPAVKFLFFVGLLLVVVGALFLVLSVAGHSIGGRKYWY
jgi:hypothetical protein